MAERPDDEELVEVLRAQVRAALAHDQQLVSDVVRLLALASRHALAHAYREAGRVDDAAALDG